MKLIQLSDTHYIVVDDSEIKEGDVMYDIDGDIGVAIGKNKSQWEDNMKITHSTEPFIITHNFDGVLSKYDGLKERDITILPLFLSEVEEAIFGYSVEKMAHEIISDMGWDWHNTESSARRVAEFVSHKELSKDKLFTIEDMRKAFKAGQKYGEDNACNAEIDLNDNEEQYIQSILPKTEWEVEFNEQGKIKLV